MRHKGKLLVFLFSAIVVLYGISAAFYKKDEAYPALAVFMDSLKKINEDYVEAPDMSKVQEGAMRGLAEALDPYSSYLTKEQVQEIENRSNAGGGVPGMVLSKRANVLYVISIKKGGGAEQAGIRPGDYVISIDGTSVEDRSLVESQSLLAGAPGKKVKIGLFRSASTKPVEVEVTLKEPETVPVNSRMLDGNVGILEVPSLAADTLEQARVKLKTLISAGAGKLVLDLRNCADGKTANGAELANFFLESGTIYTARDREGKVLDEVKAAPDKFITGAPMVVLINSSTAGAAEIAAGALKDLDRAKLVGEKSFGIGSTQKRIPLESGAVLFLSTAKYYTPDGKMIQNEDLKDTGISPDIESPDSDRLQDLLVDSYFDDQDDDVKYRQLRETISQEQFKKALEVLAESAMTAKKAA